MERITNQDLLWIVQAALQVVAADDQALAPDRALIHDLIHRSGLSKEEALMIRASIGRGDQVPFHFLSSGKAKQLCQLVVAAMALRQQQIAPVEQKLANEFSQAMGLDPLPLISQLASQYTHAAYRLLEAVEG